MTLSFHTTEYYQDYIFYYAVFNGKHFVRVSHDGYSNITTSKWYGPDARKDEILKIRTLKTAPASIVEPIVNALKEYKNSLIKAA